MVEIEMPAVESSWTARVSGVGGRHGVGHGAQPASGLRGGNALGNSRYPLIARCRNACGHDQRGHRLCPIRRGELHRRRRTRHRQ